MIGLLVILAILFCLTYDPKSRTLERFIEGPSSCCSRTDYRAQNPDQCQPPYYQGVQFGNPDYGCPAKMPRSTMGVLT